MDLVKIIINVLSPKNFPWHKVFVNTQNKENLLVILNLKKAHNTFDAVCATSGESQFLGFVHTRKREVQLQPSFKLVVSF